VLAWGITFQNWPEWRSDGKCDDNDCQIVSPPVKIFPDDPHSPDTKKAGV